MIDLRRVLDIAVNRRLFSNAVNRNRRYQETDVPRAPLLKPHRLYDSKDIVLDIETSVSPPHDESFCYYLVMKRSFFLSARGRRRSDYLTVIITSRWNVTFFSRDMVGHSVYLTMKTIFITSCWYMTFFFLAWRRRRSVYLTMETIFTASRSNVTFFFAWRRWRSVFLTMKTIFTASRWNATFFLSAWRRRRLVYLTMKTGFTASR